MKVGFCFTLSAGFLLVEREDVFVGKGGKNRWGGESLGKRADRTPEGRWKLDIRIPETYPLAPPSVRFVTPVCHPNVNFKVDTRPPPVPPPLLPFPPPPSCSSSADALPPDRRNLPRPPENVLDGRLHRFLDTERHSPAAQLSGPEQSAECGCGGAVEGGGYGGSGKLGEVVLWGVEVAWAMSDECAGQCRDGFWERWRGELGTMKGNKHVLLVEYVFNSMLLYGTSV